MIGDLGSRRSDAWPISIGASVGMVAGLVVARLRLRALPGVAGVGPSRLESQVRGALEADPAIRARAIDVGVLADGIVELTGVVRDEAEARRAVGIAQLAPGVRTVLNRLDLEILEDHLVDTRRRFADGDESLHETHWYGIRVGIGRRRQGHDTDPDRPDDKVRITSRELGADRAVEQASERIDKLPSGVEGHTTLPAAPTDRGTVDVAPHRRLGNVPEEPVQALNPDARIHENVKKGTELTLEEAGLEKELEERHLKDRS